jgi:AcrR family transcriptional regulator
MEKPRTTAKSAETRERILRTAARLFAELGFHGTTLRRIAEEADVALGLTYRYFPQKEDLALALYAELASELEERSAESGAATLREGFARAMREKLRLARPQKTSLAALFAASLGQDGPASIVGRGSAPVRAQVRAVFARVVAHATDLPGGLGDEEREDVSTLLYGLHLVVLLVWLVERRGGRSTKALTDTLGDGISRAMPLLTTRAARPVLRQAAGWLDGFLGEPDHSTARRSS